MNVTDFIEARLYDNEQTLIQDALRHLPRARSDLRIRPAFRTLRPLTGLICCNACSEHCSQNKS